MVEGIVTDFQSGVPLADASITVEGLTVEARSGNDGHFLLMDVPAGNWILRVSAPGYARGVEEVLIDPGEVLQMRVELLSLSAILPGFSVTGARSAASPVGNDPSGEVRTAAGLLRQQIPGLGIASDGSGAGGRDRLRLRGAGSFNQASGPSIYLDGVRLFGPGDGPWEMTFALRVLETIPVDNVRRFEVLRGPSARVEFRDSANGIVLVETWGGSEG